MIVMHFAMFLLPLWGDAERTFFNFHHRITFFFLSSSREDFFLPFRKVLTLARSRTIVMGWNVYNLCVCRGVKLSIQLNVSRTLLTFFLAKYSLIGTHTERWHEKQQPKPNMENIEFRGRGKRLKMPSELKPLSVRDN